MLSGMENHTSVVTHQSWTICPGLARCAQLHCKSLILWEMHRALVWMALAAPAFGAPKMPPIRPEVLGVFPHGGQRGTDVELLIRGKNLQNTTQILFATPRLSATALS